ncbi:uncharacterized protein [Nicotiana sylvestris]|uniref:Uncharacterized protein LOC104228507 n=1 Tax=Nicotiana sylvestris TaxID=4096 RepID=A0A1U7WYH5_NICSY|nr:PREDICTED: uncharacterized protein LOC104228507 [Nicotiana sylvestris]
MAWLAGQIQSWDHREEMILSPHTWDQEVDIQRYMSWYRHVTRLFIRNPIHQADGRYVPYAERHEALAIGLHTVYQMGLQMQDYIGDPADALQDYSRRFVELAARTLQRAREDQRLAQMPNYVKPDQYERGPGVARGGGARRGGGAGRRGGGRRGGGPQQGGVEAPADYVPADMPSGLGTDLTLGTSHVTPSGQLLITGTQLSGVD